MLQRARTMTLWSGRSEEDGRERWTKSPKASTTLPTRTSFLLVELRALAQEAGRERETRSEIGGGGCTKMEKEKKNGAVEKDVACGVSHRVYVRVCSFACMCVCVYVYVCSS